MNRDVFAIGRGNHGFVFECSTPHGAGDNMVGQDVGQGGLVGKKFLQVFGWDLGERCIRRCEYGEGVACNGGKDVLVVNRWLTLTTRQE